MTNLFICGKMGSGKTFFAHRYAKDSLIQLPKRYIFSRVKRGIRPEDIFLWDLFEWDVSYIMKHLQKVDILIPGHQHIICSIFPPSHYSKKVQDFLTEKNFRIIHLNGDENTPVETVVKNIDELIDSLYFFMQIN